MRSLIASIMILGLVGMIVGVAVQGADIDTVTATVTAELVSVSVTDGEVTYGILPLNSSKSTLTGELDDTQTATNDGNVTENFSIRSSDAVSSGTTWELAASAGTDAFTHEFSTDSGSSWTAFDVDNTTYSMLASNVATNGTQAFDLKIGTPTASTDSEVHTITVTVLATTP